MSPLVPLPLLPPAPASPADARAAAEGFEALVFAQLLKSARAARLSDAPLGQGGDWQEIADQALARELARGAPLGLGRLIEAAAAARPMQAPGDE